MLVRTGFDKVLLALQSPVPRSRIQSLPIDTSQLAVRAQLFTLRLMRVCDSLYVVDCCVCVTHDRLSDTLNAMIWRAMGM